MENTRLAPTSAEIQSSLKEIELILTTFNKNISIVESDIGNQIIIFNNLSEDVFVLNVTGKIIWNTLKKNVELNHMLDVLKIWFTSGINEGLVVGDIASDFRSVGQAYHR